MIKKRLRMRSKKVKNVPKRNDQERLPYFRRTSFFLKEGFSVFWNAFHSFPIRNSQEHIPRFRKRFLFLIKADFFGTRS
jgi:hypothetical protein